MLACAKNSPKPKVNIAVCRNTRGKASTWTDNGVPVQMSTIANAIREKRKLTTLLKKVDIGKI